MGLVSICRDHGHIYKPDTCKPLVDAVEEGKVRLHALARGNYPGKQIPPKELLGLKSAGFWDAIGNQTWGLDWHRNEGIEITFLKTGTMPFAVQGQEYLLQPGDLTITQPWQPHRVGDPNIRAGRLYWIILDVEVRRPNQDWQWPKWFILKKDDLNELSNLLRQIKEPVWRSSLEISQCFEKIGHVVENLQDGDGISKIAVYLNELILLLLDMLHQQNVRVNPAFSGARCTVELFLHDLNTHPDRLHQPWTVETMAEQCGMGVTSFIKNCKEITNLTPGKYLNRLRVEAAAGLLLSQPEKSITDIAFDCGFTSSQYFATSFKNHFGGSPLQYRNTNLPAR